MSRLREKLYKIYNLEELGFDFMGYEFGSKKELSTHHIIPRHTGGQTKKGNLCVLNRTTSHNYIHLIEDYDYKAFLNISRLLLEQVKQGKIDIEEIKRINELLLIFEEKHKDDEAKNGTLLIKEEYKTKRIIKKLS
jgi:hypothetical protein